MLKTLLDWMLANPGSIAAGVIGVLGLFNLRTVLAGKRAQTIIGLAHIQFHAVEEMARLEPTMSTAAKVAAFLDQLATAAEAAGLGDLSAAENQLAQNVARATNFITEARGGGADPRKPAVG